MRLTKEERDRLPAEHFAVPGKREMPINDEEHVRLAWDMLDRAKGITDPERAEAKRRILRRAHELGIDTSKWDAHGSARLDMQRSGPHDGGLQAMRFEAMSLEVPKVDDHPNRVPFSGVLTRIGEPSDNPVGGANGKRVLIPKKVAEDALPSLLGMAVDYSPALDKHDAKAKIGIISGAEIKGDAIHIDGFLYGKDFPDVVKEIQDKKGELGFSYEADASVVDWKADPIETDRIIFTGAAILKKSKAAYTSTSITASADLELDMTPEELEAVVAAAVTKATAPLQAEIGALKASSAELLAHAETHRKVKKHVDAIRACADAMEADGLGNHPKHGHVHHLRHMADKMEAEAIMGKLPHIWRDHDWLEASAAKPDVDPQVEALKAQVKDLEGKLFAAAGGGERKTSVAAAGAKPEVGQSRASIEEIHARDAELVKGGASTTSRLASAIMARAGITQ